MKCFVGMVIKVGINWDLRYCCSLASSNLTIIVTTTIRGSRYKEGLSSCCVPYSNDLLLVINS